MDGWKWGGGGLGMADLGSIGECGGGEMRWEVLSGIGTVLGEKWWVDGGLVYGGVWRGRQ